MTCPRCKIYQSHHQGYVTPASHWSVSSRAGLWLADAGPRGELSVAEPPSQDNHTPSHPNGHKNPANGEMSPWPDSRHQRGLTRCNAAINTKYWVSQPRYILWKWKWCENKETRYQRPHMSGPGAWPAGDNHLICLSDKTWIILKYFIHPFLKRETKSPVRCSWSDGSRRPLMALFVRPVSTRRCKWPLSGLWQYDTGLMASPLFMTLSVLSVFGIFPWYLCSESCCRPFNPT